MQVISLLTQLSQSVIKNPAVITAIPWDDLTFCILNELQQRKSLYTAEEFQRNYNTLATLITTAQKQTTPAGIISSFEKISLILSFFPDEERLNELFPKLTFYEEYIRHHRDNTLVVLGDSHVNFFSGNENLTFTSIGNDINTCPMQHDYPITTLHMGPSLAYSCNNENSSTSFKKKVDYLIKNFLKTGATLLVCLGEIDLRAHVLKQADAQGVSPETVVDNVLTEYFTFLLHLKECGFKVNVWGPIASQKDNCVVNEDLFPRFGSEVERNKATLYFTEKIKAFCEKEGFGFYTLFYDMVDENLQTIPDYISEDACHLGTTGFALAIRLIQELLS